MRAALLALMLVLAGCSGSPELDRARLGATLAAMGDGMSAYGQGLAAAQPVHVQANCTSNTYGGTTYTSCR